MKQALVADQIERIAIKNLRIASWNARKTFDPAGLEELKLSIKAHGIQVPLIARPVGAVCEIVAGHRRFYAGLALWEKGDEKFEHLPCIVRELNDDQAREIGLVDNLQREDVPPLEEADAYAELRTRLGSLEAIATRVNKQASYVARRLQLVTLGVHSRRAVDGKLISIDHALILARLGGTDQDEHLKWCLKTHAGVKEKIEDVVAECEKRVKEASGGKHFGYWEPQSVLDLKDHVESYAGRKLSRAPWKLDDAELVPEAGACEGCPSNTKSNRTLFDDLAIDKATCANSSCFESKRAAFVEIALGKAALVGEAEGVKISWKPSEAAPRMLKDGTGPNLVAVLRRGQWVEVKKGSCVHARSAATVDWSDNDRWSDGKQLRKPGEVLLVCMQPKCKAHPKAYETRAKRSNGGYDPKAEEGKREKMRREAAAETKIRVSIATSAINKIAKLPSEVLRILVVRMAQGHVGKTAAATIIPGYLKTLQTAKVDSAEFAKAAALVSISEELEAWQYASAASTRAKFLDDVTRLGYTEGAKAWDKPRAATKPAVKKQAKKAAAKKKGGRK